jgi:hypothetical protein
MDVTPAGDGSLIILPMIERRLGQAYGLTEFAAYGQFAAPGLASAPACRKKSVS